MTRAHPPALGFLVNVLLALSAVCLGLVLAEGMVRIFHLWPEQRAVLKQPMSAMGALTGEAGDTSGDGAREATASVFVIHPFVGWVLRPSPWEELTSGPPPAAGARAWLHSNFQINAFGFHSAVKDYRRLPADDFVIAVFGGSMAQNLAMRGGGELVRRLETRRPELAGSIWVLNLAIGGYKQPQQLILLGELALLGVPVDVVVNLDGFNEVVLGADDAARGFHPLFPSRGSLAVVYDWNTRSPSTAEVERVAEILRTRREEVQLRGWVSEGWRRRSRLLKAWVGWRVAKLQTQRLAAETELRKGAEEASAFFDFGDPCLGRPGACHELIADLWQRASLAMAHQTAGLGALYLHALQPNQYVEGSKSLSAEERVCCWAPEQPWSRSAREGLPLLRARGALLRAAGVDFHDLTGLFADRPETVYEDKCCHLDDHGNELLGAKVGDLIADVLERHAQRAPAP